MDMLTKEQKAEIKPYPYLLRAESVINWRTGQHPLTGKTCLLALACRSYDQQYRTNALHPDYVEVVSVHRLDETGLYVVDRYEKNSGNSENVNFINGQEQQDYTVDGSSAAWKMVGTYDQIMANNERLQYIPIVPLNGSIEGVEPMLMPLIDREVSLYNKVSRRNHLLLGSATYTPVIVSDMTDDAFEAVVSAGLGSWIKVGQGDDVKSMETPSKALKDMEAVIQNTIAEMARLGIRMMAEESGDRASGVSLEIRNAGQSALLASLSNKVSQQMRKIIVWMLNWEYGSQYKVEDVHFNLTPDLNPAPIGADWLRLVTEWYQGGLIPRSTFLDIAKANDIIDSDYDDIAGQAEIGEDDLIMGGLDAMEMEGAINKQTNQPEPIENDDDEDEGEE